ncbi:MAG: type I DNA topoisomerase [Dialister sp.]|nr:type I DNA topoisomerase [Dialister sp.]MDY3743604.1 type I DNA topoisomerase [Dialister sp.]MDY4957500.1 type I DNA topoisomerase [Dialister sp.]MDY5062046.1 type I DNA topoisomerase [Dialister sp.]
MPITRTITIEKKKTRRTRQVAFKRKPNPKGKHLVVVESPAKAKTIERILGPDYKVMASMGHLRDLPKRTMGVDIENGFAPEYVNSTDRANVIKDLQKAANQCCDILLATDPDREGEAISWHLSKLLDVNPEDKVRIAFHEITPPAIREAIQDPEPIDLDRVDAQQARRVLDRLVGYKLSPWLWRQVYRGLSAGRVQSVATRLICEREEEIRAFVPVEYWSIEAMYKTEKKESFKAKLTQIDGKDAELHNGEETDTAVKGIEGKEAEVTAVTKSRKQRKTKPPYTTSTMQQDAVNKLNFSSKKTMMLAQNLYEGVEIPGHGHVGLITYMRTDSTRISDEMIKQVRPYISETYGEDYLPAKPNVFSKSKEAQDAHEAIRPTSLSFPPSALTGILSRDQLRLYTLIWNRFIASQMAPQIQQSTSATLQCGIYTLKATGVHVLFDGFTIMQPSKKKDSEESDFLPPLKKGDIVKNTKVNGEQHFTAPPPRYTEASLIKTLEEKGIGRPSTYAPILDTIQKRRYVTKENKQFVPTEVGFKVTELLKKYFEGIINVDFTANLENWLDKIAEGKATYKKVMTDFYKVFAAELASANVEAEKDKKENQEVSDVTCEKCGAKMIVKMGRYGKYLACPNYPNCKNIKPYSLAEGPEEVSEVKCDACAALMVYRTGPYGRYLKCPSCGANKAIVIDTGIVCPKCHEGHMVQRRSHRGRIFYGCSRYPKCDMALWNEPINQFCETCGAIMTKKTYKTGKEVISCSNPDCPTHPKRKTRAKKEEK